ncbi:MAG: hypothetical protein RL730_208 [Actinomycetota bacterium]
MGKTLKKGLNVVKNLNKILIARLSLAALFLIVTVLQVFSFPGQFAHMRRASGISLLLEILLTVLVAALFLCAQIAIFSLSKIVSHIHSNTFYSSNSYIWMNRFVSTLKIATLFPISLIFIIAPQADDPGVLVMLMAITFFVVTSFVISALLRDQIQSKPIH